MVSLAFIRRFLFNVKFWDIFVAFLLATLPFIFRCSRRPHFVRWAIAWLVPIRLLCVFFANTYGGNIAVEAFYSAILILLMIGGLLCCFEEKLSNVLFYFSSGFATWYISDRLFLVIASICRLNSSLVPYFTERTPSHILLYITCFLAVYLFIYFTVGKKMHALGDSEIPMQNALLFLLLDCMLTPIFYFESGAISQYNIFFYNLLNIGEIIFLHIYAAFAGSDAGRRQGPRRDQHDEKALGRRAEAIPAGERKY